MPPLPRRTLLHSLGATAVALLAGCNTSSDESTDTTSTPTATRSTTKRDTSTETETHRATELNGGPGPLPEHVWPLPNRGPSNGAYLPDGPLFESEPVVDWQVAPTTSPTQDNYTPDFTIPVIADGRLYTVTRLWFGTNQASPEQHYLRGYDTTTGDELWTFTIPQESGGSVPTRPVIGDGVVLVGLGQRLYAVGVTEGNEVWNRGFDQSIDAVYPTQDRTYVKMHRSLMALNAEPEQTWTKEFDAFPETLARGNDHLYVTVSRQLMALDPTTGEVRWQRKLPAVEGGYAVRTLITVADGVFALQNSGDLYAFSETGTQVWHADDRYQSFSTDGTRVYARTEGMLRALSVTTGQNLWELRCEDLTECDSGGSFRKPVVTDNVLYSSHSSGRLVAVRPTDGTVLWSLEGPTDFNHLSLGSDAIYGVGFELEPLVKLQPSEA